MIKAKQIPDEVAQALIATLYGKPGLPYREAIAAAINSWPGVIHNGHWLLFPHTKLPFTESGNE